MGAWPRKRVGAGVLLRDPRGRVLLVEPTYKADWEIPGGLVEEGESPLGAVRRELVEELGTELPVGELLCIHWCPPLIGTDDGVMLVFDAGTTDLEPGAFTLPTDELRSARFVEPGRLDEHVVPAMARRLRAAIDAAATRTTAYLEG